VHILPRRLVEREQERQRGLAKAQAHRGEFARLPQTRADRVASALAVEQPLGDEIARDSVNRADRQAGPRRELGDRHGVVLLVEGAQ